MALLSLPVDEVLPELWAALEGGNRVILEAPPGAGKSTQVPLFLLPKLPGRILMLEPRRLAARSLARYLASRLGEKPGQTIGYRTRTDSAVGPGTRLEIVTEGILVRRLQNDPELDGISLVIFDEFHERNLVGDLALALALDVQEGLRDDLKLLVMSATLEGERLRRFLEPCARVQSQGRSFPVDIRYQAPKPNQPWLGLCESVVLNTLAAEPGSMLVFLPGGGEIRRLAQNLEGRLAEDIDCYPLYGDLDKGLQDAAIAPPKPGRRKLVLATPIAETSLTIEGIRLVVDAGWCRRPMLDGATGMSQLKLCRISQASATQRAGRAGRLEPGIAIRLWGESQQQSLAQHSPPEILEADLGPLALELAQWGTEPGQLHWLDSPPAKPWREAQQLLDQLDALEAGKITAAGRAMARLGCHPRLAHMLTQVAQEAARDLKEACLLAALLEERDPFASWDSDIASRLPMLGKHAIARQAERYQRQLKAQGDADWSLGAMLSLAYPERIARQVAPGRYRLAMGRGAVLAEGDRLWGCPWLVVAQMSGDKGDALIRLAAPVDEDDWRALHERHIRWQPRLDWEGERLVAQQEERYGALVLASKPLADLSREDKVKALCDWLRRQGSQSLPWDEGARQLQLRIQCAALWLPGEPWPLVDDDSLMAALEDWLGPYLGEIRSKGALAKLDLAQALRGLLPWPLPKLLDDKLPSKLLVPTGQHFALEYRPDEPPVLSVPIQALYGQLASPTLCDGAVTVTCALLSPARRPLQVTRDLAGFWAGSYSEVRKEMRGRYPKHDWPEDPANAKPTRFTKKRQQSENQ
ncbi:ATP-dependent helicase HrpB [Gallaecimonas kandeliae]|uniref:ATP-dependent helicase HrpB n=1 Tax=Gallaecimonas kandeliae TaxID=3029055 RepID=UPI0026473298|nr:ATP-dependent helicase HrpB [Gallaecimonas kandeliae]WKE66314.1 ATP-dependent helicase HrpB [Gallaecimonas kandeliae]